jgi:hypothetical protein
LPLTVYQQSDSVFLTAARNLGMVHGEMCNGATFARHLKPMLVFAGHGARVGGTR